MFGILKIFEDGTKKRMAIKFARRYYGEAYAKYQNEVAKINERKYHFEVFNFEDYKE